MITVQDSKLQLKIEQLYTHNQGHIFRFWNELTKEEKETLLSQVNKIDIPVLKELLALQEGSEKEISGFFKLEPTDVMTLKNRKNRDSAVLPLGEEALRKGEVAAFLVAGGQGSRLGFDGPKGIFPVTPVKQKPLFQLFAEKLRYLNNKYNTRLPWYIMTSETNHEATVHFFEEMHFFGLSEKEVRFFKQDMLPAFDKNGKIIMEAKHRLFFSPNGHGGSLQALYKSGSLADMEARGIKHLFYFQVDNVLVNMCDPLFLGYHIAAKSEMSTKVIRKTYPEEKMGVICKINGQDGVVEYSDLSKEETFARTEDGELKYWAGNTAIHMMDVQFLLARAERGAKLPYHRAEKNIPCINDDGIKIESNEKNGIKYETFIFDLLLDVQKSFTLEADRSKEFSAVKNKEGSDSPAAAKQDLLRNYAALLTGAGIPLTVDAQGNPEIEFEISPLFAQSVDDINAKRDKIPPVTQGTYLGE